MKSIINFYLFIFSALIYSTFVYGQSTSFHNQFSSTRGLVLVSIDTTSDGGYISAGNVKNAIGNDYFVVKVDNVGNEQWRRENNLFNTLDSSNSIYSVKQLPDHSFIMCGTLDNYKVGHGLKDLGYLVKLDSTGGIKWEKMFSDTGDKRFIDIRIIDNNFFYVLGEKTDSIMHLTLDKIDSSGNSIWSQEYSFPTHSVYSRGSLVDCLNSDLLIFVPLDLGNNTGVIRIDSAGTVIQQEALNIPSEKALSIKEISYHRYELISQQSLSPYNSKIIKLDSLFSISSVFTFSELFNAVIADSTHFYGALTEIYIYNVSSIGDTIWTQFINEPFGFPNEMIINKKGCVVTCGNIDASGVTASIGFINEVCDSTFTNVIENLDVNDLVELYPNPTNQFINIKIKPQISRVNFPLDLTIFDNCGKLLNSYVITQSEITIPIYNLKTGAYTISIKDSSKQLISNQTIIKN